MDPKELLLEFWKDMKSLQASVEEEREARREAVRQRCQADHHSLELAEIYIVEGEAAEGPWYWDQFETPADVVTDFLLYVQQYFDTPTPEEINALYSKNGKLFPS